MNGALLQLAFDSVYKSQTDTQIQHNWTVAILNVTGSADAHDDCLLT